jgi:GTPase
MGHKAGFVNIVGNPNVGKSTLMNVLVGERISIITSKSQTTRHRIMGIVNTDEYQIVYSDTPGVLEPKYKLQESMLQFSKSALTDADVILYVTDVFESAEKNISFIEKVKACGIKTLLIINKIDKSTQEQIEALSQKWQAILPEAEIIFTSATAKFNTAFIFEKIVKLLPEAEPFFDKDALTDKPMRFFVSEIIREKILLNYDKEIPYSSEVLIEEYKDTENLVRIRACIMVERDSQKGILIGHKGSALKKVGTEARLDIESFIGNKVFLELYVKVDKDWRNKEIRLKNYGYLQ